VITPMAADQHPGQGPVTGESPTRLGRHHARPAGLTTHHRRAANQAVQVHGHRQLRPDPTGLGQPAPLQAAAGQLGQGIGPALPTTASVGSILWAGQGLQRRHHQLAGFGLQQPVNRHHALPG
jgi:hypothetical protein